MVEAALGYYINPILSVLLGVVVLRERMAVAQWVAVALAGVAVVVLAVEYGHPPWVSLVLAASFATYGFLKKRIETVSNLRAKSPTVSFRTCPGPLFTHRKQPTTDWIAIPRHSTTAV